MCREKTVAKKPLDWFSYLRACDSVVAPQSCHRLCALHQPPSKSPVLRMVSALVIGGHQLTVDMQLPDERRISQLWENVHAWVLAAASIQLPRETEPEETEEARRRERRGAGCLKA